MPYAKHHRKEKEKERNKKRYIKSKNLNWNKGKNNPMYGIRRKGEKNPNWKGGVSKLNILIRQTIEYKQWRSDVYKRDNWTCQTCNKRGAILEAHHIKKFIKILKEYNIKTIEEARGCKELWDINNGVTLCKDCHNLTKQNRRLNKWKI